MTVRVSVSDLLKFQQCPRLWHAARVEGLDDSSRPARVGSAVHAACDAVTEASFAQTSRPHLTVAREAVIDFADKTTMAPDEMHEALQILDNAMAHGSSIRIPPPANWQAAAEQTLTWTRTSCRRRTTSAARTVAGWTGCSGRSSWGSSR